MKTIECAFLNMNEQICFVRSDATKFIVDESAYSLEATFPLSSEKTIDGNMMIGFADIDDNYQIYKIINKQEDPFGKSVDLYAEHAGMIELLGETIIDKRPTKTSAGLATQVALEGTRWQLRTAENVGTESCRFWYCSVWEALQKISSVWGCTLQFAWEINDTGVVSRNVTVKERQGDWRGKRFELSKGITDLKIKTDTSAVVTALYGRGKGEELSSEDGDTYYGRKISFADVEWSTANGDPANKPLGQEWVEDQAASAAFGFAGRKRSQVINFDECEDPEELLDLTWAALQQLKMPKITVRGTVADLENAWGYGFEAMRMGDTAAVVMDEVNLEAYIDVTSIKRNYIFPEKTSLNLGNVVKSITDLQADYNTALKKAAENAMLGAQVATVNPGLLKGIVDTMVTQILSSGTNMYTDPNDGSLVFVNALGNAAVRITGNGILISNKKIDGEWQWNTAIAGNGIVADVITSGTLQANLVRILGTAQFYWDSDNIYIISPNDGNKQIRIGAYDGENLGIGFTQDGGETWQNAIGFNGVTLQARSVTQEMLDSDISYVGRNFVLDSDHTIRCGDAEIYSGDGTTKAFSLPIVPWHVQDVRVDGELKTVGVDYTVNKSVVTFVTAPSVGAKIVITYFRYAWSVTHTGDGVKTDFYVNQYARHIPGVYVNDVVTNDYQFDSTRKYIVFNSPPANGAAIKIQFCADAYYKDYTNGQTGYSSKPYMFSISEAAGVANAGKKDKLRISFYIKRRGVYSTLPNNSYASVDLWYMFKYTGGEGKALASQLLYTTDEAVPEGGTDDDWVRIEYTINLSVVPTSFIEIGISSKPTGGNLEVKRFQVELGTYSSAWSAAPEDLSNVVSTHTTQIETHSKQISLKASQTDFDALTGRVETAEGKLTVQADQIAAKVSAGDIASSLNLTPQSVLISSSKINLTGYVTITSLGAGGSTAIDGSRITTGMIAAARIDVSNLYVKHLSGADGTFTGTVIAGNWRFDNQGSFFSSGNQQVQMQVSGGTARYTTSNLSALYGSTSYNETRVYGGAVVLDCSSTGQSVSARNGHWGSYSYSDVCFVCDQAGSSYDSARGNLGTTDNRWDILWCDTVHYRTRASDSSREVKHDIAPLPNFGAKIDQLQPVRYKYKDDKRQQTRYGLIYEDTIELMPDICIETQEGGQTFKGISYEDLIAVLIGEVKELRKRVSILEKKLAEG